MGRVTAREAREARDQKIYQLVQSGKAYKVVAYEFGLSRKRVGEIVYAQRMKCRTKSDC